MPVQIIPPRRDDKLLSAEGFTGEPHQRFFEAVAAHINEIESAATGAPPSTARQAWNEAVPAMSSMQVLVTAGGRYLEALVSNFTLIEDSNVGYRTTAGLVSGSSITQSTTDIHGNMKNAVLSITRSGNNFILTVTNTNPFEIVSTGSALVI